MTVKQSLLFSILFFLALSALAQETVIVGKIIDRKSKEALPFVSVGFIGTRVGTTSDFEGNFTLKTTQEIDSISISYVGYQPFRKRVKRGEAQTMLIELRENTTELREVVIRPGENPALRIIRKAQENRDFNDQRNLTAYEYDSYSKMDLSLNNISEKMKERKVFKPLKGLFDTVNQIRNDDGKYILPIFLSETFSRYHYLKEPSKTKEVVKGSSATGIGMNEQSYVTDLLGTSFIQFNFNQNWMRLLGKDFISPIAFGSNGYYIYTLEDSVDIEGIKCYKIKLNLRREEDLGFLGTMWIADSTFAIKRINVEISPSANINFIDRLKIQQEMSRMETGQWLPNKTRLIIDIAEFTKNSSGLIAKMYTANTHFVVNQPKDPGFYESVIYKEDDVYEKDSTFWQSKRTEDFSAVEKEMFHMVDSVKNLPIVKTYVDVIRILVEGYHRIGKLDWGPYIFLYGYNAVEYHRFRLGFKTNQFFHRQWVLKAYLAYGTRDEKFKYNLGADYIFSKKKWTAAGLSYKYDYDVLGITTDVQQGGVSNLFATANIISPRILLNETREYRAHFIIAPKRDWTFRAILQHNYFSPLGRFRFEYMPQPENPTLTGSSFTNVLATIEARFAYKEVMVPRGNERLRVVRSRVPILTFQYSRGIKDVAGSDFNYDKASLNVGQHLTTGAIGTSDYSITVGKIFGILPYPLLNIPRGNQSPVYADFNFSLMNLYEFVSDEYVEAFYIQHFEGLFTNRIPLLRKLKWRNFATVKAAYGTLSEENKHRNFIGKYMAEAPHLGIKGEGLSIVHVYNKGPYAEASVGFENIFHILSVSYIQRLTYVEREPGYRPRLWGINIGLRIEF